MGPSNSQTHLTQHAGSQGPSKCLLQEDAGVLCGSWLPWEELRSSDVNWETCYEPTNRPKNVTGRQAKGEPLGCVLRLMSLWCIGLWLTQYDLQDFLFPSGNEWHTVYKSFTIYSNKGWNKKKHILVFTHAFVWFTKSEPDQEKHL
jgi:hypothetical protein